MKKIKALTGILLCILLMFGVAGCSKPAETEGMTENDSNDLTSLEVSKLMGNGINLGNTMEAFGRVEVGLTADISAYETIWGQPVTTREMIEGMKAAGFDSIRIPVAWTNTMDYENDDFTIRPEHLDRVEEIVNYALDADMYVIINDHWDGGWWGMFGSSTDATREKAMNLYKAMWSQVSERFKDYSYKLILESANEELGSRLNDRDVARDSGALSEDETYEMTNLINQTFVDLVRATGGKNTDRFLLIAGFNTDIEKTVDDRFKMPTDSANEKLLLSVHYYTPWAYTGTTGVATWGTESHYSMMNDLLKMMTKYTEQGYGVVFGEYAVLTKNDGSLKNNTLEFTKNFLDNCDLYGYVPMLWDTNAFFKRDALKIEDEGLSKLFYDRRLETEMGRTEDDIQLSAKSEMDKALAVAIENDKTSTGPTLSGDEDAVAWIMFNSVDYAVTYSVGDSYDPSLKSDGVIATDVVIESAGTYTVGLDFTQTGNGSAESLSFSALGISNGELLFPGYIVTLKEVLINGQVYNIKGVPYTTADDEICTRVNLYNGWVSKIDLAKARFTNPNMANALSATLIDPLAVDQIETLFITFEYAPAK